MDIKKIAIVSDIHAHQGALEAFLKYIETEKVDFIFNLGDFVSEGKEPCQVFDQVMNNRRFINISGFDEEELLNTLEDNKKSDGKQKLKNILGEKRLKRLKELPRYREVKIGNKRMLFIHRNGASQIAQQVAHGKEKQLEEYDYIFYGGSHKQEFTHIKDPFIKNKIIDPGSLASLNEGLGYFVVMDLSTNNRDLIFKNIELKKEICKSNQKSKEIFMHVYQDKYNARGEKVLPPDIIEAILKIAVKQSRFISIGCWDYEKKLIKELLWHLKCREFKKCINSGQEWYMGEINEEVIKLLIEKNRDIVNRFKWLEVSFYDKYNAKTPIYSIHHYGSECFLRRLMEEEQRQLENLLKEMNISYSIDANRTITNKKQEISCK
ncbi:hypothetical protein CS063_09885 [Sporanaerobium hydrogeniformans]|uniref:Uncharacterized protein n=1 Tax=Sporanaerobium hydrogeniformans TaxID=3072179 RepID=A0AC61DC31_9FIRM|nr:metallophosphoesterase family protein [Sporanaerobium hydrogeniformans]PHV70602.1 hypothetical protein CS063_09885 [Sporanaerobium hydrogeniformans]